MDFTYRLFELTQCPMSSDNGGSTVGRNLYKEFDSTTCVL